MKIAVPRKIRTPDAKPSAAATIEPVGSRRHAVRLVLKFDDVDPKFADRDWVIGIGHSALAGFVPAIANEAPTFADSARTGGGNVLGVEGYAVCEGRPESEPVDQLKRALTAAGYGVVVREVRACREAPCTSTAVMDWGLPDRVPGGWYDAQSCGKHGYKRCETCASTYVMNCINAAGSAPSVHCQVCGGTLIEWGGTKVWTAELLVRDPGPSS